MIPPHRSITSLTSQDIARFWSKVKKGKGDECWPWLDKPSSNGYGRLIARTSYRQYYSYRAHRISWTLANGAIPAWLCVLHACDNRMCVNPAHLFLGTRTDNTNDMIAKGRLATGERCHPRRGELHTCAKLTPDQVREIRREYADGGVTQGQLAKRHGVCTATICRIIHRERWQHVA